MRFFTYSEAGHNHQNEDATVAEPHPLDAEALLCFLADGQGGQAGGAVAAQTAMRTGLKLAGRYTIKQLLGRSSWYEIICGVDEAVSEYPDAGFTTFIGLCVANGKLCGVSCGDSAALLVHATGYTVLTENQRKNPPVGSGGAFPVAFTANIQKAIILLMSDGVWRYVGMDTIAAVCREKQGQECIMSLRRMQTERNDGVLPDDFSVVLLKTV